MRCGGSPLATSPRTELALPAAFNRLCVFQNRAANYRSRESLRAPAEQKTNALPEKREHRGGGGPGPEMRSLGDVALCVRAKDQDRNRADAATPFAAISMPIPCEPKAIWQTDAATRALLPPTDADDPTPTPPRVAPICAGCGPGGINTALLTHATTIVVKTFERNLWRRPAPHPPPGWGLICPGC